MILGPVNGTWDEVTRVHPSFWRHTSWSSSTKSILAHTSSILIKDFEVKVYSDNGLINNTGDADLVYMSNTAEDFVNKKDDIEFKISSSLTAAECRELDVTDSVKLSTPITSEGEGLLQLTDVVNGNTAKAEQLYVDAYYTEYHEPRLELTQDIQDRGDIISYFNHFTHPALDKEFYVTGISRSVRYGYATLIMKELFSNE